MRPALEFVEVRRTTGLPQPVRGLSFAAEEGLITAAVSSSIALKATIQAMSTGHTTPRDGAVLVFGEDISRARPLRLRALRRKVAVVGAPGLGDNGDGLDLDRDRSVRRTLSASAVERLELSEVADERVGHLPAHLRRRVAIGRALATRAPLVLINGFDLSTDTDEILGLGAVLQEDRDRSGRTFVLLCRHDRVGRMVADATVEIVADTRSFSAGRR